MEILARAMEKLAQRLPEESPEKIEESVLRAEEYFKARTKRLNVPETAFWLLVDLAGAICGGGLDYGAPSGAVASIKRGDTQIQYADGADSAGLARLEARIRVFGVVVGR